MVACLARWVKDLGILVSEVLRECVECVVSLYLLGMVLGYCVGVGCLAVCLLGKEEVVSALRLPEDRMKENWSFPDLQVVWVFGRIPAAAVAAVAAAAVAVDLVAD